MTLLMIRLLFGVLLAIHGLIHLIGVVKAFGIAEVAQLTLPISRPMGLAWLAAMLLQLATVGCLFALPRWWWVAGAAAAVVSQAVIISSWADAKYGTWANTILILGVACGYLSTESA